MQLPPIPYAPPALTDQEYVHFRDLIHNIAGIRMTEAKKVLMAGRLARRLRMLGLESYQAYYRLVTQPGQQRELQTMVDLLTTNETYFFREKAHFEFLATSVVAAHPRGAPLDIWSAASSTGEEIYTIAFVLAEALGLGGQWSVTGSDLNSAVLETAQRGEYLLDRTRGLPDDYRARYCTTARDGDRFTVNEVLRRHTRFLQVNLNRALPPTLGRYHVIFLRNVMIYFDNETKRQVVARIAERLHPGGYLIIGHSESLTGLTHTLTAVRPTVYQRAG